MAVSIHLRKNVKLANLGSFWGGEGAPTLCLLCLLCEHFRPIFFHPFSTMLPKLQVQRQFSNQNSETVKKPFKITGKNILTS